MTARRRAALGLDPGGSVVFGDDVSSDPVGNRARRPGSHQGHRRASRARARRVLGAQRREGRPRRGRDRGHRPARRARDEQPRRDLRDRRRRGRVLADAGRRRRDPRAARVGQERDHADRLHLSACRRAHRRGRGRVRRRKVTLHGTGEHPGGITERFPLTFSAFCRNIRHVRMEEFSDIRNYAATSMVRDVMLFGQTARGRGAEPDAEGDGERVSPVDRHGRARARMDARPEEAHASTRCRSRPVRSIRRSA